MLNSIVPVSYTHLLLFGVAASLENDLGSLATGLGDDGIGLIANLGRLGLGGVGLLEACLLYTSVSLSKKHARGRSPGMMSIAVRANGLFACAY